MLALRSALILTFGLGFSAAYSAQAQTAPNCPLANMVDSRTYDLLTVDQANWNEAAADDASYNWAQCRATRLRGELARFPQVSQRTETLRRAYRKLRGLEGELAGIRSGGGTLYRHAIPRSYPALEEQLASLSALARSRAGAQTGQAYARAIAQARADHAQYLKELRAYRPSADFPWNAATWATWNEAVRDYETTGQAVMQLLGSRGDAATTLGYSILNDVLFSATDDMN